MKTNPDRSIRAELSPRTLVAAYSSGAFPMPDPEDEARIVWFSPDPRGLLPLDERFHVPRRLGRTIRQGRLACTIDRAFPAVMRCCADRPEGTWITDEFLAAYGRLHELGLAHSVEVWPAEALAGEGRPSQGTLLPPAAGPDESGVHFPAAGPVGGIYGVALGGAFFAESMFHRVRDAGSVALVCLVQHLRRRGFVLCDVQWRTPHLTKKFGAYEVARTEYLAVLSEALSKPICFAEAGGGQGS